MSSRLPKMKSTSPAPSKPPDSCNEAYPPLEFRFIQVRDPSSGALTQVPALDKRWAPSLNYIEFYLPSFKTLEEEETSLLMWLDSMEMYCKDLTWLLSLPHHKFWSVMVHSPEVPQVVLQSFLLRAPQWFDKEFLSYLEHEVVGPKYQEIYSLVFRTLLRLCTHKENKQNYITPITWSSLLVDHQILDILKLQSICVLYDSPNNVLLPKMIENVMKNSPKLASCFKNFIPVLVSKSEDTNQEFVKLIRESNITGSWDQNQFDEILSFFLSTTCSLYKFCKVYPPAADTLMKFPNTLIKLAMSYEPNCCNLWGQVIVNLPILEERVTLLRTLLIRLFRVTLATPTIDQVGSSNDPKLDKYLEILTNCLDEKIFIRDYEKLYPFKQDVNLLLNKGVFIDETTIDYVANAISSCFHACGENYAVEKIVVDPLYDPNFDRQLLGACSLDVTGVELQSLVSQVHDILPDLPFPYVESVLKHYEYNAETAINALLEGSVPSRLEKYKNTEYVGPLTNSTETELEQMASKLKIKDVEFCDGEKFYSGKRRFEDNLKEMAELKPLIKGIVEQQQQQVVRKDGRNLEERYSYIDESLLPNDSLEYEDEYDDTYDGYNVGMTEPDLEYKPLNQKMKKQEEEEEEDEEEREKKLDFCEDPAVVRARLERRKQERRRGPNDVVGKAKGQGQDKDVVYARRQKTQNKDGYKKKRADFKRREF